MDTTAAFEDLVVQYQRKRRPITVNFRSLIPSLNSPDRVTHLIHPYPAKLLAHIPFFFLANNRLSQVGDSILDPFCGSGTVLLEAQLAQRRAYGADSNPLARLIARVKTTPIETTTLNDELDLVLRRLPRRPTASPPSVVNLDHWFHPETSTQLQCLYESISDVTSCLVKDFLLVCFSVCVRKVSTADPRLSVPVRLKLGQYPHQHPLREKSDEHLHGLRHVHVSEVFRRIASANIGRMERLLSSPARKAKTPLISAEARELVFESTSAHRKPKRIANESVQLIITSPPYPGAQKYIRASSLSLGWLQLCKAAELRSYKARSIGREEFSRAECRQQSSTSVPEADRVLRKIRSVSPIRATIATTYLNEMAVALREMERVLKPGGFLVLVAANNKIAGKEFRTVDYLTSLAEQHGLALMACFIDAIK